MEAMNSSPSKKRKDLTNLLEYEQITVKMDPHYIHCGIYDDQLDRDADHHVFRCINDHVMCAPCAAKVGDTCPNCLSVVVNHCIILEIIIDGLRKPCPFSVHDCNEFTSWYKKPAHKARCPHAPLCCLILGFVWVSAENSSPTTRASITTDYAAKSL